MNYMEGLFVLAESCVLSLITVRKSSIASYPVWFKESFSANLNRSRKEYDYHGCVHDIIDSITAGAKV